MFRLFCLAVLSNLGMLAILNLGERGEAGGDPASPPSPTETKSFTQDQVNHMMAENKKGMQTDLMATQEQVKILQDQLQKYQVDEESKKQAKLEEAKEYDKLKEGWSTKENEYKGLIDKHNTTIKDMQITHSLTAEISKQNGYLDAVQLVKSLAQIDDKGIVKIKGKNASGVEDLLSVEEGVKAFLKDRQYLVKSTGHGGSGSPPATGGTGGQIGSDDPMKDARELEAAMRSGNRQKVIEIKARISAKQAEKGINAIL